MPSVAWHGIRASRCSTTAEPACRHFRARLGSREGCGAGPGRRIRLLGRRSERSPRRRRVGRDRVSRPQRDRTRRGDDGGVAVAQAR